MQFTQEFFDSHFITAQEIARELGTTVEQVHNLVRAGKFPESPLRIGARGTRVWERSVMRKVLDKYQLYKQVETRGRKGKYS